jgi:aquaporin Z
MVTAAAISVDVLYYTGHDVDYVSRWLARGFIAAAVIYAFAEISGAHANPAVTFGFALRRLISVRVSAAYVAAQFAGSFAATLLLFAPFRSSLALGASHPGAHITGVEAMLCEVVLTFVLMVVILMTATEAAIGKQAALAVGFSIAVCGMAAGPISGASMNPARTIAPQIVAGVFGNIWIYFVGPLAGSALASGLHALMYGPPTGTEKRAARGA